MVQSCRHSIIASPGTSLIVIIEHTRMFLKDAWSDPSGSMLLVGVDHAHSRSDSHLKRSQAIAIAPVHSILTRSSAFSSRTWIDLLRDCQRRPVHLRLAECLAHKLLIYNTYQIQSPSNKMIFHTRTILTSPTSHKHHRMLLYIVPYPQRTISTTSSQPFENPNRSPSFLFIKTDDATYLLQEYKP